MTNHTPAERRPPRAAVRPAVHASPQEAKEPAAVAPEQSLGPDLEPSGLEAIVEEVPTTPAAALEDAPAAELLILNGPASYGPVTINGQSVRCKKDVLYHVPDLAERAAILLSGRFRGATKQDLARAGRPSAGPGGAVTRDLLPPGALKGGLREQMRREPTTDNAF